ncbi:hypothetical protein GL218_06722 [Daldinia childiae]|uniref:uncharacterized protein n=1 Tax=Daldinia childiae TaxID=326645 RepID=UPI00144820D2|nr:uncharacterized protein GL218_06722 [Daldinia childiae]KAF3056617.1 hypothetical protein GL218_06722 [Daldinia childiae]
MLGLVHGQPSLSLPAVTGRNNISVFECWQLTSPFIKKAGMDVLRMDDIASALYHIIPPRFDSGRHPGPAKQYVWVISGLMHMYLPNATDEVVLHGGRYGLMYIDDTADISVWGHRTTFPGGDETTLLMIPVRDGINPPHWVLYDGPCKIGAAPVGDGEWMPLDL